MNVHGVRIFAAAAFFASSFPLAAFASVTINEVAWMGTPEQTNGEWIELYNDGEAPVDLAGWKLYESGGSTMVFTLTKSIEPGGYLVIERTTPSVPDALSGINDEVGSFGGGGLNNTGEHLVLKDKNGQVVHDLDLADYGGKWPAGDSGSKHTMQWNGTKWITAEATPKADNRLIDDDEGADDGGSVSTTTPASEAPSAHSSDAPLSAGTIAKLTLDAGRDRLVPRGVEVSFEAQAREAGSKEVAGVQYSWAFGDGGTKKGKVVSHEYRRPGTYVVVVNAEKAGRRAAMRFKVTVIEPEIKIRIAHAEYIEIENLSEYEVNLQGWKFEDGDDKFEFPQDTIILPKAVIQFDKAITGLSGGEDTRLYRPGGNDAESSIKKLDSKPMEELHKEIVAAQIAVDVMNKQIAHLKSPRPSRLASKPALSGVSKPLSVQVSQTTDGTSDKAIVGAASTTGTTLAASAVEIYSSERADSRGFLAPIWESLRRLWGGE